MISRPVLRLRFQCMRRAQPFVLTFPVDGNEFRISRILCRVIELPVPSLPCATLAIDASAKRQCASWTQRNTDHFVSFAAGVLIAVSFLHLVPEALGLSRLAPGSPRRLWRHAHPRPVRGWPCLQQAANRTAALGLVPLVEHVFHSLLDGLVYSISSNVSTLTGLAVWRA